MGLSGTVDKAVSDATERVTLKVAGLEECRFSRFYCHFMVAVYLQPRNFAVPLIVVVGH